MSSFWPVDLELTDTQSPREILKAAQEDWITSSNGVIELLLKDSEAKSGHSMLLVYAKHVPSNRTAALFTVLHRVDQPYPVTIQLEDRELPNFLKKSYHLSGKAPSNITSFEDYSRVLGDLQGQVSNEWVSDTPTEFRRKLKEAFNQGTVKTEILNLVSSSSEAKSKA